MLSFFGIEDYILVNQAIILVFSLSFVLQILYWAIVNAGILSWRAHRSSHKLFPVSVVICAKNEELNLSTNLPLILEQDYPEFEVLVVNDASTDGTEDVLRDMKSRYPHLRTTSILQNVHIRQGKKLALTIGIKGARYDWVVLTDADCRPAGRKWLHSMQRNFSRDCHIVLGIGKYETRKGLLNTIIRFDTLYTVLHYTGFAMAGHTYMGVGRNLAYRKSLFFHNKGFASHYSLASGDDDLFINEVARGRSTRIEIRPESHTISEPESRWRDWYYQKRRHLTTGPRYRLKTRILLGGEFASRMLFYFGFISLLSQGLALPFILVLFTTRLLLITVLIKLAMIRLEEKHLLLPSLLLDFALPCLQVFMVFSNYVALKRDRWK